MSALAPAQLVDGGSDRQQLAAAFAAARSRLGMIAVLLALAGLAWWSTADRMAAIGAEPGTISVRPPGSLASGW